MCDAEDPCSVNTAHEPESSFTTSPRSTTRPLYVLHNELFLPSFCACSITSCLLLIFDSCHAGKFFSSHSLSTSAFASEVFIAWCRKKGLCTTFFMTHRIVPLFNNVIFMISVGCFLNSPYFRFVGLTFVASFVLLFFAWSLLRISPCHCSSKVLSCRSSGAINDEFPEVVRN